MRTDTILAEPKTSENMAPKKTMRYVVRAACGNFPTIAWFYKDTEAEHDRARKKFAELVVSLPSSAKITLDYE